MYMYINTVHVHVLYMYQPDLSIHTCTMNGQLLRQGSKATTPKDNYFFSRENLRWDSNPRHSVYLGRCSTN